MLGRVPTYLWTDRRWRLWAEHTPQTTARLRVDRLYVAVDPGRPLRLLGIRLGLRECSGSTTSCSCSWYPAADYGIFFPPLFLRASRTDGSYRMDQTGNPDRAHRWFQSPHPSGQPTYSSAQTSCTTQVCRQQEKSETHISDNSCLCMSAKLILSRAGAQTTASFCPPLFSLLAHAASFEPDVRLRGRDLEVNDVPAELAYSDGACIDRSEP